MRGRHLVWLWVLLVSQGGRGASPATQPATAPDNTPVVSPKSATEFLTESQLVQAYRARQFALLLQETTRIQSHPAVLTEYNLFNLLVLRGEAFVQTHGYARAVETFTQAAPLAPSEARGNFLRATALLLTKQTNGKYLSKTSGANGTVIPLSTPATVHVTQFDVLDLAQRTPAIHALANDLLAEGRVLVARDYATLPALAPLLRMIEEAGIAEQGATGDTVETGKLRVLAGEKGGLVMQQAVDAGKEEVRKMGRNGLAVRRPVLDRQRGVSGGGVQPAGDDAESPQQRKLEGIVDMTAQVPAETEKLVQRLSLDPGFFQKLKEDAAALRETAEGMLKSL